jgi:glycosyltransferase involved in cell wall biosynthesis
LTEIHQFLPTFAAHDAIGMHVLRIRGLLREAGFVSDIYADEIHDEMRGEATHYREFDKRPPGSGGRWLLYHSSTGSPMVDWLCRQADPLIVDYHNITEAKYFDRWAPVAADSMRHARDQLRQLAPHARFAMADSPFNEQELLATGYRETAVAPILIDFNEYDAAPNARLLAQLQRGREDGGARWLFVGRVAPNKCQHDVVAAFAAYRALFDANAHLTLVGGMTAYLYWRSMEGLINELELSGAVTMADSIGFPELLAYYRTADVFVVLSEHEGFNVPVLEAMHFDVPVVAYASSAVPDTVGDAGVLLTDKDPVVVATAVDRVLNDTDLRTQLVGAGRGRVDHFSLKNTGQTMLDIISGVVNG